MKNGMDVSMFHAKEPRLALHIRGFLGMSRLSLAVSQ